MSKQAMEPPKPLTTEEILGSVDEDIAEIRREIAEMKAQMLECLKTGPNPYDTSEVEKLKEEIIALKVENISLKQQIKDMWESFSAFFEKQGSKISNKWNSFFAKKKESATEMPKAENTITPSV